MSLTRRIAVLSGAVVLGSLAGCSSSSGPSAPPPALVATPSFATDIQPIFNQYCSNATCHGSNATVANGNLDLRPSAYSRLVGVASSEDAAYDRVSATGDTANSYLVMKLEGTQTVGSRMPKGGAALNATLIQNIKNWIANGAPNN